MSYPYLFIAFPTVNLFNYSYFLLTHYLSLLFLYFLPCVPFTILFLFYYDGSLFGLIFNIFLSIFLYLSLDVTLLVSFKSNIVFNNIYSFDGLYLVYFTLNVQQNYSKICLIKIKRFHVK